MNLQYFIESMENLLNASEDYICKCLDCIKDKNSEEFRLHRNELISTLKNSKLESDVLIEQSFEEIIKIIELLLNAFMLPGNALVLFKKYREAEKMILIFDVEFRDHIFHAFFCFLTGCTILSKLELRINSLWECSEGKYVARDEKEKRLRTFRSWFLASIFHDIGYPAQKLEKIREILQEKFFRDLQLNLKEFAFDDSAVRGDKLAFFNKLTRVHSLDEHYYSLERIDQDKFFKGDPYGDIYGSINKYFIRLYDTYDHSMISAFILFKSIWRNIHTRDVGIERSIGCDGKKKLPIYDQLLIDRQAVGEKKAEAGFQLDQITYNMENELDKSYKTKKEYLAWEKKDSSDFEILEDLDISVHAIAKHHYFNYLPLGNKLRFSKHPLAYLLSLIDELQQWGRISPSPKIGDMLSSTGPRFDSCMYFSKEENSQFKSWIGSSKITNFRDFDAKLANISTDLIILQLSNIGVKKNKLCERLNELFNQYLQGDSLYGPSLILVENDLSTSSKHIIDMWPK